MKLQVWQDGWTASNARGKWVDVNRGPTTEEINATIRRNDGMFFIDHGKVTTASFASAGALLYRVVYDDK